MDLEEQGDQDFFGINQYSMIFPPNKEGYGALFLGQLELIYSNKLEKLNIGAVLSIIGFPVAIDSKKNVKHLFIQADDDEDEEISQHFQDTTEFIQENLKKTNVYVHCQMGISRSASLVLAYLMKEKEMNYLDALNFVRSKRACVSPNEGFEAQLMEYSVALQEMREHKKQGKQ